MITSKYLHLEKKITKLIPSLKKDGKKIVLCHGVFDLVHPGHIDYFKAAKSLGEVLVVTITADKFIKKNMHSPHFDELTRYNFLSNIKIIDYVFIINEPSALSAIKKIKPNFYCKGTEYKKRDSIGNLEIEKKALSKIGGKIRFLGKNIQSSSKLISQNLFKIENKIIETNLRKINQKEIKKVFKKLERLKVLVIGEAIIDKYTYVEIKGVSPKSNTLSCIKQSDQIMPGGVLATYNFAKSIVKSSSLISIISDDIYFSKIYRKKIGYLKSLIHSKSYPSIIKDRFVERHGNHLKKILTLNHFEEKTISEKDENLILKRLKKLLPKQDIVVIQDFGHNLLTKKIINLIQNKAKKISVNVQSNSLNYGFNIINKKYKKVNFFSLNNTELELSSRKKNIDHLQELRKLCKDLLAEKGFLTCGGEFSLVVEKNTSTRIPTLNTNAIDTMGAGDIFHLMSSILSCVTNNNFLILFLSQIAGAHAVNIPGNSDYPKVSEILKTFDFYKNAVNK